MTPEPTVEPADATATAPPVNLNRILTVPNVMSLVRLACIPLFLYLLFGRDNRAGAAWLLGGLGATDWIDGYVARHFNQVSELGKILDPTADRLMFIVGIGGMIIKGGGPVWFYWLVVAREALFGGTVLIATIAGMKRFDVTWWGKLATFLLMFAVPGLLIGSSDLGVHEGFKIAAWILAVPGIVISYYTAIAYIPVLRKNLREGRTERAARTVRA
ncbi:MAG TPA: CDP-alcohol phosphatidyltransferase family protein [Ilumatobacteraceae bacterium]